MRTDQDDPTTVTYPFGIRSTRVLEIALTVVVALGAAIGVALDLLQPTRGPGLIPVLVAAGGIALAFRWRTAGIAVLLLAPIAASAVDRNVVLTWTLVAIGSLLMTLRGSHARYVAPVAAVSAYLSEGITEADGFLASSSLAALSITFAAAVTGSAVREHFRFLRSVQVRADQAVHTRTVEASRRITEERLRIARDLHDVVGHQVAVVNMQIGMAEVALPPGAETSRTSLHAARDGVRLILQESQRILTVLRLSPNGAEHEELAPAPELDRLGDLVASFRNIGLDVDSRIELGGGPIEGAVSTSAYRVVQEALTNAHRHGGGSASVSVTRDAYQITVDVSNDVVGDGSDEGSGFGLLGMKERIQSVGGTLAVDRQRDRFHVHAVLPLDGKKVRA